MGFGNTLLFAKVPGALLIWYVLRKIEEGKQPEWYRDAARPRKRCRYYAQEAGGR
jgi:hypothetical protein